MDIAQAGGSPLPIIDTGSIYKAETINGKRIENNRGGILVSTKHNTEDLDFHQRRCFEAPMMGCMGLGFSGTWCPICGKQIGHHFLLVFSVNFMACPVSIRAMVSF